MKEQFSRPLFDDQYYAKHCGEPYEHNETWLGVFRHVAGRIVSDLNPKSVLDAGCAWGFLVETLRERGVEAWGIDISSYAISQVTDSIKPFCRIESITHNFEKSYDLITCIEVVEHMEKPMAELGIKNLCEHTDRVLFSSSPNDYAEATHFNVQPTEVWAREFARHGFYPDLDFDATFIAPWAMLFTKSSKPNHQLVYDFVRKLGLLLKENQDLRKNVIEFERKSVTNPETTLVTPTKESINQPENATESFEEIRKQRDTYFQQLTTLLQSEEWQTFQEFKKIHND